MKFISSIALLVTLMAVKPISAQSLQISNIQWPQLSYTMCTQSDVYVNIIRSCYNSTYSGATITVSGLNLTVDVNYTVVGNCNTILDFPGHQISCGILPAGTYAVTVNAKMNGVSQATMTSTLTVSIGNCCPYVADAGNDTTVCNLDSVQLNAVATPSYGAGKWTVSSGTGIILADTVAGAWATNLSSGTNIFTWTTTDTICTTYDSVIVLNHELPSNAMTELDKSSCFDTISIHATPPTVGTGKWTSNTSGIFILNSTKSTAQALNMSIGINEFVWTVSNKICPKSNDTLRIDYSQVLDSPAVSVSGMMLTSDIQPSYQWYKDQNAIPGETNQSYTVIANGTYSVYAVSLNCSNGLFSEEIEITGVGIEQRSNKEMSIYPNPSKGLIYLDNVLPNTKIIVLDQIGRQISTGILSSGNNQLDLRDFPQGLYYLRIDEYTEVLVKE